MHVSPLERSTINADPKRTLNFLDLPGEIRNQIYSLVLPPSQIVRFRPRIFENDYPEEVCIRPYLRYFDCAFGHRNFRALGLVNRQIGEEVRSIFYGRPAKTGGNYFTLYKLVTSDNPVSKLYKTERHACVLLQQFGIPWAIVKTRTWFSSVGWHKYELLVPDRTGGRVTWRKLTDVGNQGWEIEDEIVAFVWQKSVGQGWKWLSNW